MSGLINWDWNEINNALDLGIDGDEYDYYESEPCNRHAMTRTEEEIIGQFCDSTGMSGKYLVAFLDDAWMRYSARIYT